MGATLRLYFSRKEKSYTDNPDEVLAPVILAASTILQISKYLEIDVPTAII